MVTLIFASILLCIIEAKRIPKVNPLTLTVAIILFPIFILLASPFDVIALFSKNLVWKPIPHNDTTSFDKIHGITEEGAE